MSRGIRLSFLSDVADFLRGTRNVEDALEEVTDALEEVTDAGKDTGRDTARALDQVADEADEDADKVKRSFRDSFDTVRDKSREAGRGIGKNIKDGTDTAAEGMKDLKEEAGQSAREAAASFSGDPLDALDMLQETAANALAGFGPAGAAAGLAAAVGIGLAQTALQDLADRINEAKEEAGEMATEVAESGKGLAGLDLTGTFREWATGIRDARSWWEVWQEDAVTNIEAVSEAGQKAGVDLGALWSALNSSDIAQGRELLDGYKTKLSELSAEYEVLIYTAKTPADRERLEVMAEEIEGYEGLVSSIEETIKQREAAEDLARQMLAAENDTTTAVVEQAEALREATEAQAGLAEERRDATDATRDLFDAETNYADQLAETTEKIGTNTAGIGTNTEEGRANRDALLALSGAALEQAEAMATSGAATEEVSGYLTQAREDFLAAAAAAGVEKSEAEALADRLLGIPGQVATDLTTTAKAAKSDTADYIEEVKKVPGSTSTALNVNVSDVQRDLQRKVDSAARRIVMPTLTYRVRPGKVRAV